KRVMRDNDLKALNNRMSFYQRKIGKRLSVFQMRHIETQMSQTIKNKHFTKDTFFNSFFYYRILSLLNSMLGNLKESYKYDMKVLTLFKDKSEMKELQIWKERYVSSLSRLITSASLSGNNDMLPLIVDEINSLDISDKRKAFADINITDIYLQLGEFEQSIRLVKSIEKNIDFYTKNLGLANRTALYFNLAVLNFGLEEYSRSLNWVNAIINSSSDANEEIGINNIVRILRLILYYELGRFDVLEYDLRSTSRYIDKQKRQYKFDKILLDHFRKTILVNDDNEKAIKVMAQTRNSLAKLTKIKAEQQIISYFDFISWLDSRLQHKSFSDLVKERVHEKHTNKKYVGLAIYG
ncbi:MAG TPA: hypothetical protein VNG53_01750, partial [Bacteroidia bacterium]|nr:hypothetical protein [Bacteroidia bacterium]